MLNQWDKALKLNIGCHDIKIEGFENLDIDPSMKPDKIIDCTKLTDHYEENSIDFIYTGHFLEHFEHRVSKNIIKDFYNILKPYGSICAVVPDYLKVPEDIEEAERIILGAQEHLSLFHEQRLINMFKYFFIAVFPIDIKDCPWTPFSYVKWQSAIIAIKTEQVKFR